MTNVLTQTLKRWRENYYFSRVLSSALKPIHALGSACARQIQTKVRRNGASVRLPNGQIMRISRDAGIALASALYWQGYAGVEPETSRALRFFFERAEVFIDVGANYGHYSILGALWNPNLRIVAFEPLAPIYECLRKNIEANHLESRVVCENLALISITGLATLYLPPSAGKDMESTATLSCTGWQARQQAQPLPVQSVRLDDYVNEHPIHVDLIKIDVEDFEADVLQGMAGVIRRDRPFIVCEILPRNREHKNERTRQIIQSLGYVAYWITSSGYIRVTRFDFEREYVNFLLSPVSVSAEVLPDPLPLWHLKQSQNRTLVS